MTFEELNRTMEFLVEQQARMSATLDRQMEQSRQDQQWSRGVIKQLATNHLQMVELMESNSRRLDENDRERRDFMSFQRDFQKESQRWQQQIMAQLQRILERLTSQGPNHN